MDYSQEYFERTVIAFCFFRVDCVGKAVAFGVNEDWFTTEAHKQIWKVVEEGYRRSEPIDMVWIFRQFKPNDNAAIYLSTEIPKRISEILIADSELTNALEAIKESHVKRQMLHSLDLARTQLDGGDYIQAAQDLVLSLSDITSSDNGTQVAKEQNILNTISKGVEISTGYGQLDYYWGGITPSTFIIIGGFTSNCKSLFAANIAYNVATKGYPVLIASTQLSEQLMQMRFATIQSGINYNPSRSMTNEERDEYMKACTNIDKLPMQLLQTSKLSQIHMKVRQGCYKLVVVDYVQRVVTEQPEIDRSRYLRVGCVCEELEKLALENETCVIGLSQLHRPDKQQKEPDIHSYRDSGEIEEGAMIACILWYPYQNAGESNRQKHEKEGTDNLLRFMIAKNNLNGVTGRINFRFDKGNLRITADDGC